MPQTLSDAWRRELGEDCEQIHEQWLHSIANLTLTAYNSDYSNRPFAQKRDMAKGFRASGFRMNQWIAAQERWGADELEERCERLVDRFLELWPMPQSSYEPVEALPEQASLDSDVDITGRRISAFSFLGERHAVKQWNTMVQMVMRRIYELKPAKVHALVDGTEFPASFFRADGAPGYQEFADGMFVRTGVSNYAKAILLRRVFEICGIDEDELTFEMPLEDVREDKRPFRDTQRTKLAYWTLYQEVAAKHPEFLEEFEPHKAAASHYSVLRLGSPAYHIALLINTQAGRTGIEFYVPSDKTIGHLAIANKELFEERLGLAAESFDAKKASGVRLFKDGHPIKDNEEAWPGYIEEQLAWALEMKKVLTEIGLVARK